MVAGAVTVRRAIIEHMFDDAVARLGQARLARARRALALAELRTGVGAAHKPASNRDESGSGAGPWDGLGRACGGVVSLVGSRALLLALAARLQGARGWCAVIGGEDLGWCAAAEAGLALDRVLVVPAAALPPETVLAVVSALIDGVDVLVLTGPAAMGISLGHRRTILARARHRGATVLVNTLWEGARLLTARPAEPPDDGAAPPCTNEEPARMDPPIRSMPLERGDSQDVSRARCARPAGCSRRGDDPHEDPCSHRIGVVDDRPVGPGAEMPEGYLTRLTWLLEEEHRGPAPSRLVLDASGVRSTGREPGGIKPTKSAPPVLTLLRGQA